MLDLGGDAVVGEEEALEVGAEGEFVFSENDELAAIADFFEDGAVFVQLEAALVEWTLRAGS